MSVSNSESPKTKQRRQQLRLAQHSNNPKYRETYEHLLSGLQYLDRNGKPKSQDWDVNKFLNKTPVQTNDGLELQLPKFSVYQQQQTSNTSSTNHNKTENDEKVDGPELMVQPLERSINTPNLESLITSSSDSSSSSVSSSLLVWDSITHYANPRGSQLHLSQALLRPQNLPFLATDLNGKRYESYLGRKKFGINLQSFCRPVLFRPTKFCELRASEFDFVQVEPNKDSSTATLKQDRETENEKIMSAETDAQTLDFENAAAVLINMQMYDSASVGMATQRQMRTNSNEKVPGKFVCDTCGKSYQYLCNLRSHENIHTDKAYICEFCSKRFGRRSNYEEHRRVHTRETPFGCVYCGKRFRHQHAWKDHTLSHVAKHKCRFCKKRFKEKHLLARHQEREHWESDSDSETGSSSENSSSSSNGSDSNEDFVDQQNSDIRKRLQHN